MANGIRRPSLFQPGKGKQLLHNLGDGLVNDTLSSTMKSIIKTQPQDVEVKQMPKYLKVTEKRLDSMGVIDLKPFFANSADAKQSKKGGWYVVVPIRRKTRGMSRRMYDQLRSVEVEPGSSTTVATDYLYDRRRASGATMLNYEPQSNNITKEAGSNGRSSYVAYRTVSDKSPMNSWILNRDKVNKDDTSKTFVRNVDKLIRWKMKNM